MKIDDLKNGQDGLRSKKRDLFDHNKLVKRSIAEFFGELRNKIDIKEKEIIKSTDNTLEGNIKEIDKEIGDIEGNISVFFDELDLINNHLNAKDEALLLNFYSNQGKSIEKSLYSNEMPLQKPDLPCLIDLKELEQQISGLTDQIIGLNPVSMIDNMHSISKSPNKLFSNMKYSPISNKNDENGFENEKPSKNSNTYENRPPKGINRLTNSKTVLKPYNL